MRREGHEGSLGEYLMQQSGSHAQGHRNKNIFLQSGLRRMGAWNVCGVAEKVRAQF